MSTEEIPGEETQDLIISIIIPIAKEGDSLFQRVASLSAALGELTKGQGIAYEIILISDVLHKPTLKAMMKLAKMRMARALFLTRRLGKGGSVKNAVRYARGAYLVVLDADVPVEPTVLHRAVMLAHKDKLDLVLANRRYRPHNLLRRTLSLTYNLLVNILFRTGIKDHQAGFKILSRRAAEIILTERTRTDWLGYDTEIIVWAKKYGFKYRVIDVVWKEQRDRSTIIPFRATMTMLADLIALRLLTVANKYAALRMTAVGKVVDLATLKPLGDAYMTIIEASGPKRFLFAFLRRLYIAIATK